MLWVDAADYTPLDGGLDPTGEIGRWGAWCSISGCRARSATRPFDTNLVVRRGRTRRDLPRRCAARGPDAALELWTDEPALQVFDAAAMTVDVPGTTVERYGPFAGLCLEAQHFPDGMTTRSGLVSCARRRGRTFSGWSSGSLVRGDSR